MPRWRSAAWTITDPTRSIRDGDRLASVGSTNGRADEVTSSGRASVPKFSTEIRVMSRQEIEEQVHGVFTSPGPARDAALSEVRAFFDYPEALQALRLEVGPAIPPGVAVLCQAIERGVQWAWAAHHIRTNQEAFVA